ncbi:protein ALTERED PHOSPHATE STARVATION RESPONSE 1 [Malania oleifera]|uniref:protein ALTERED PHOSPHATE STARVATION RESPONSE 1 n=1 Tax=Malania oleifera TaxID=397392 RepID=UPI0025ADAE3A|nr:protein ALTERED PHOSPHATE STARVATION RESPONSE 1 [Malania oleifera]
MGCTTSRLDDEEAVQLCKDRKRFIKQAVEHRMRFASGHIAYIQSLKRVSAALRDYIEGDEPREFLLDTYTTPPFTPLKKTSTGFISISEKPFSAVPIQSEPNSSLKINYLRSGGNPAVVIEERPPQSPETVRIETYPPMYYFGVDGFFEAQSSPMNSSFSYTPNNRPNLPPPSPQNSHWDFFWNPFTSLDYYGHPSRSSLDQAIVDDEITGMRQVREEEGIPDLEEEEAEEEEIHKNVNITEERTKIDSNCPREEVIIEDEDEQFETDSGAENDHEVKGLQSHGKESIEISQAQNAGQVELSNQEKTVGDREGNEETPGYTVYVNRRPTSMAEIIKDLEAQFTIVCNSANEISAMLEASRAQISSTSSELTAMKMLNPVALIRSASSRSSSSRFLINSSSSKDEGYESSSDFSEESCMFSGSHQSTLDRLYAWEKKLFEEVRSGERFRIAYEKKCMQLSNQDVKGEDPTVVDKTRVAIRDLHTQMTVSIHSVEAVSKRIETLRDEELQPQLLELVQGLARMWKVMAECHQSQKRTLDEAKHLLAGTPSKLAGANKHTVISRTEPHLLARPAANLETEIRNWRACFESWINSQRSYVHALTGWLLRCVRSDAETIKMPFSPRSSSGVLPIFGICIQWSRFLDAIHENAVLDGLDFFASGMGSLYAQQQREDSRRAPTGSKRYESSGNMEVVGFGQEEEEEVLTMQKMAEVAVRVLCAGMSVAMSSLSEFAIGSAEAYADLANQWENAAKRTQGSSRAEM